MTERDERFLEEIAQRIDKALDGDCGYGVGKHLAEQISTLIAEHDATVRAEALREAADMIPDFPEPENPYSYDPWDDDSVDPTNTDEVVHAAVNKGWDMGAHRARTEAARTIREVADLSEREAGLK